MRFLWYSHLNSELISDGKMFDFIYVSATLNEKVKILKEERGIHSVQPSAETAEHLNQDDILRFSANISNNPHDFFESK